MKKKKAAPVSRLNQGNTLNCSPRNVKRRLDKAEGKPATLPSKGSMKRRVIGEDFHVTKGMPGTRGKRKRKKKNAKKS